MSTVPDSASFRFPLSPPTMASENLLLRLLTTEDQRLFVEASADAEITRWTLIPPGLDDEKASELLSRWLTRAHDGHLRPYAIALKATTPPVGVALLVLQDVTDPWCADVAYWLLPRGRGRGLATGAVKLLIQWAFGETALRRAALYTLEGNGSSEQVAVRCGFRFERIMDEQHDGQIRPVKRWALERGLPADRSPG
jgi:ribosomal-protein-alanine N-acetyltransferase